MVDFSLIGVGVRHLASFAGHVEIGAK